MDVDEKRVIAENAFIAFGAFFFAIAINFIERGIHTHSNFTMETFGQLFQIFFLHSPNDLAELFSGFFGKALQKSARSLRGWNMHISKNRAQGAIIVEVLRVGDGVAAGELVDHQRQNMYGFANGLAVIDTQTREVLNHFHLFDQFRQQKQAAIGGDVDLFTLFDLKRGNGKRAFFDDVDFHLKIPFDYYPDSCGELAKTFNPITKTQAAAGE